MDLSAGRHTVGDWTGLQTERVAQELTAGETGGGR
jgi:hypothetical protein